MSATALVSVLMTSYNREAFIAQAIESVLGSVYTNFELIISDDCSTDATVEVARNYAAKDARIKVFVNEQNLGDYPNRNKAASYATGEYIKYLDSDDIMYPHCLQVMAAAMEQFPEAGFGVSSVSDAGRPYPVCLLPKESYHEHFYGYGHFDRAPGSAIIRRKMFEQAHGFSGERMIGDNELWFRLARTYPLVKFQRDLVWDRVHAGQESKSQYAKKYELLRNKVLNAALDHPDCPLEKSEVVLIRKQLQLRKFKQRIKQWL